MFNLNAHLYVNFAYLILLSCLNFLLNFPINKNILIYPASLFEAMNVHGVRSREVQKVLLDAYLLICSRNIDILI